MENSNDILEISEHGVECVSQNLLHDFEIMCKFGMPLPNVRY